MSSIFKTLIIFFGAVIVATCVLTPLAYSLLLATIQNMAWPFSRVFDRVIMVVALVVFVLMRKEFSGINFRQYLSVKNVRWRVTLGAVVIGVLISLVPAIAAIPTTVGHGQLVWRGESFGFYAWRTLKIIPTALLIALIEEVCFRLFLFCSLRTRLGAVGAGLVSSIVYAAIHFIAPDKTYKYPGYSALVGFEYLGHVFNPFVQPGFIEPFFGLVMVGLALCYVFHKTSSLSLCIGLHAGWIMVVKLALNVTRLAPGFHFPNPTGQRYFFVGQPGGWIAVAVAFLLLVFLHRRLTPGLSDETT